MSSPLNNVVASLAHRGEAPHRQHSTPHSGNTAQSSTMMKQKMKPFGRNNNNLNSSFAAEQRSRDPRASKGKENPGPRRDSKTPKTNNLTTIGGAYGLGGDYGLNPMRKKPTKSKKRRDKAANNKKPPDPSPLKRPDPDPSTSVIAPSKQPKSKTSVKSIISSALKRNKSNQFNKRDATEVSAKVAAPSAAASSLVNTSRSLPPANNEYDQLSDMDTACSTPEKESPLITSPRNKPDPPTKPISHSKDGKRRQSQMEPVAKKDPDAGALYDRKVMEQKNRRPGKRLFVQICNHSYIK